MRVQFTIDSETPSVVDTEHIPRPLANEAQKDPYYGMVREHLKLGYPTWQKSPPPNYPDTLVLSYITAHEKLDKGLQEGKSFPIWPCTRWSSFRRDAKQLMNIVSSA